MSKSIALPQLLLVATKIADCMSTSSISAKSVLTIELEAVKHTIVQKTAIHLDVYANREKFGDIVHVKDDLETLFKNNDGIEIVIALQLLRHLNSSRLFIQLFNAKMFEGVNVLEPIVLQLKTVRTKINDCLFHYLVLSVPAISQPHALILLSYS